MKNEKLRMKNQIDKFPSPSLEEEGEASLTFKAM